MIHWTCPDFHFQMTNKPVFESLFVQSAKSLDIVTQNWTGSGSVGSGSEFWSLFLKEIQGGTAEIRSCHHITMGSRCVTFRV